MRRMNATGGAVHADGRSRGTGGRNAGSPIMSDPVDHPRATHPEGRGCSLIAILMVLIALAVFAIAVWINAPSASPEPKTSGAPPTAPGG